MPGLPAALNLSLALSNEYGGSYTNHSRMKKSLLEPRWKFSSTCSQVRAVARLLRLGVNCLRFCELTHIPSVSLRNPETWKSFQMLLSGWLGGFVWARTSAIGGPPCMSAVAFADESSASEGAAQIPSPAITKANAAPNMIAVCHRVREPNSVPIKASPRVGC